MSRRLHALLITAALIVGTWLVVPVDAQSRFWVLVNGALRYNGPIQLGNGSASAPSQSFVSETNTGWYRAGAGNLAAAVGGTSILSITSTGMNFNTAGAALMLGGVTLFGQTAPTISSGFGTSPSVTSTNGSASFRVNVGTGTPASGVVGLPTASNGWNCQATDMTTNMATRQSASSTTTATFNAATNWTASDILVISCFGF